MLENALTPDAKISFWRQALPEIKKMLIAQWRVVLGCGIILAACHVAMFRLLPLDVLQQIVNSRDYYKAHPELLYRLSLTAGLVGDVPVIVMIGATYFLATAFLQKTAPMPPRRSLKDFAFWLGANVKKYALWFGGVMGGALLAGALIGVISVFAHYPLMIVAGQGVPFAVIFAALSVAACGGYFFLRLFLVTPLAIMAEKSPLKNSLRLTKGQCGNIFFGLFVLFALVGFGFAMPMLALLLVDSFFSISDFVMATIFGVFQGMAGILCLVILVVYQCVIYDVLSRA